MGQEHKEYTWNLIAKKLNGEASAEELRELEVLLRNNPELHYPMQTISDLWKGPGRGIKKEAEMAFSRHLDRMKELKIDFQPAEPAFIQEAFEEESYPRKDNSGGSGRRALLFVSLGGALLLGILWYNNRPSSSTSLPAAAGHIASITTPAGNEIFTSNGSRTHLALPDGTLVWLNAGSHLTYDKNYGSVLREVNLTGEAFFDVAKNAGKPFLIHTARIDIKVLGTSFNVKSYPTDRMTEATLLRGSIEVSIKDRPSEKIILKPNEKLVVANDDSTLHRSVPAKDAAAGESLVSIRKPTYEQTTGAIIETSWVDNKLIFREEAFSEVARQMERWYGVTIRFGDPGLERLQFTGSFKEETMQQALEALKLTARFNYTIEGTQVILNK